MTKPLKFLLIAGIVIAVASLLIGVGTTVVGMVAAFDMLNKHGTTDPTHLAGHIARSLWGTMVGLIGVMVGTFLAAVVGIISAVRNRGLYTKSPVSHSTTPPPSP